MPSIPEIEAVARRAVTNSAKNVFATVTHEVNAVRQPIRNLIISKPFATVIASLITGALLVAGLLHLI